MEVFPASVALVSRALMVSARWAGRSRQLSLEQMTAAAEANRVAALEEAFVRHGPPKHLISEQEGIFTGEALAELLMDWNIKQRFGAVGKHGSIAVTERAILTLKQEWLRRVPVMRNLDHLGQLCDDFTDYYNGWRGHSALGGTVPSVAHRGEVQQRPDISAKTLPASIERRSFPDTRVTAFRLAA